MISSPLSARKRISLSLMYVLYALVGVVFAGPLLYLFVASFKPDLQIVADMSSIKGFIPYGDLSFQNYKNIFAKMDFFKYFMNSTISTLLVVLFGTIINAMIGYALGLLDFRGKNLIVAAIIGLMIIPSEAVIINRMLVAADLHMLNTMSVLVIPALAYPAYVFLFYNHFKGMPKELLQAAIIDGSGYVRSFWSIMLPLSKPVMATVAIMTFIRRWGDLIWPTLVTRDDTYRTLPQAMKSLYSDAYVYWGEIFAFGSMVTIPTLIIFLIFQKQFIQSVASSGVKG
ncbi:carbohydrate ABC transporter permease [Cohnella sp. LGH]|uniref:carbohydrate ABC transporter permease n=1 Tax=Cohnella sp. LGH TaxID=1619153 RepID=UPI001AD99423|nr:carbohydrate ABC transporter permease [Cohnella sp. LGH]QTH43849.1 carbohydrate ABC transporter permease [Cohnella sp. LGH]